MLGLWIVQNTKDFYARNEILQPLPVLCFLVLEHELIDLSQRKGLLLYQGANVFADVVVPVGDP